MATNAFDLIGREIRHQTSEVNRLERGIDAEIDLVRRRYGLHPGQFFPFTELDAPLTVIQELCRRYEAQHWLACKNHCKYPMTGWGLTLQLPRS